MRATTPRSTLGKLTGKPMPQLDATTPGFQGVRICQDLPINLLFEVIAGNWALLPKEARNLAFR